MGSFRNSVSALTLATSTALLGIGCAAQTEDPVNGGKEGQVESADDQALAAQGSADNAVGRAEFASTESKDTADTDAKTGEAQQAWWGGFGWPGWGWGGFGGWW